MARLSLVLLGGLVASGCGSAPRPTVAQPAASRDPDYALADQQSNTAVGWYELQFGAATIESRRPDGSPWHVTRGDDTATAIGGIVGFLIGNPELGASIGGQFSVKGGDPLAPRPYVAVKIAGRTYRTMAVDRSYSPKWEGLPIAVDARSLSETEPVVIQVVDATDDGLLGQVEVTLGQLVARSAGTFTNLHGSVPSLDFSIRAQLSRTVVAYDLVVPSERTFDELLKGAEPAWGSISVLNGDSITIEATGQVCAGSKRLVTTADFAPDQPRCFDADGVEGGGWQHSSYKGLQDLPHASLVALMPGGNVRVGKSSTMRVEESGRVFLLVNDADVEDNHGQFRVHVVVQPPM